MLLFTFNAFSSFHLHFTAIYVNFCLSIVPSELFRVFKFVLYKFIRKLNQICELLENNELFCADVKLCKAVASWRQERLKYLFGSFRGVISYRSSKFEYLKCHMIFLTDLNNWRSIVHGDGRIKELVDFDEVSFGILEF